MSLPTPHYKLSAIHSNSVYDPAEDTFLLMDAIEKDIQTLRAMNPQIALEIGCGSGVVSTFLNQALGGKVMSFATDLNPQALDCTMETARLNNVEIQAVRTDLETGLDHLKGKVDILMFNPPYVPTENEPQNDLERCWAGGVSGRGALDRLMPRIPELLSPHGVFYLVALHANNITELLTHSPLLKDSSMIWILLLFLRTVGADLVHFLAEQSLAPPSIPLIRPTSYDLQIQLPLSEITNPDTPLFTAHVVLQFQLTSDLGLTAPFVSDSSDKGAKFTLSIDGLDHFENVSLVFNGTEVPIANVVLTDLEMELTAGQPVLFSGRYTLSVGRYKGTIGSALYYRDAGEHAAFGSALFPNKAASVFPTVNSLSNQVPISVGIVHPKGTKALSSTPQDSFGVIDENWQMTSFRASSPIPPSLLAFALLPDEFTSIENTYTGIRIGVHFNSYRIRDTHANQLLNSATQVLGHLKQLFSGSVAMPKVDIVLMADVQHSASFGTFFLNEVTYLQLDYANQVHLLASQLARHWIGGLVTVSEESETCMMEDIVSYIGFKIAKRMTNDDHLRLAHYLKVLWNEDVFATGRSLFLHEPVDEEQIVSRCGLRGVVFLESLEAMLGERHMLTAINQVIFHTNPANVDLSTFMSKINETVDEGVGLSQVLQFWRQHGGLPALEVDKFNSSIRLKQIQDGSTVQSGNGGWERMPLWPLTLEFTEFKLPVKLMLSQGIHLAPVREGTALANLGFVHFYRVNYDMDSWKAVLNMLTQNATLYTSRERAQLTYDFCHFYAENGLAEPAASQLRDEWLKVIQLRAASFPACEAIAWRCALPKKYEKLNADNERILRKRLFDSLTNVEEMTCGRGAVHDAVNDLCKNLFGKPCF